MTQYQTTSHPFGQAISEQNLIALFGSLTLWEDKYRQLIQLGKQLPTPDPSLKNAETEIQGCENRVWLGHEMQPDGTLHFYGDSEGRIVRGLLAVILTGAEGKTPQQLLERDPLALFDMLGLRNQLSASRASGMQALADAIQQIARRY